MSKELEQVLKGGGVAVIPTDTMYGVVGLASNKKTVERIYELRKRDLDKPFIILIDSVAKLKDFGIGGYFAMILQTIWPDKISVILPVSSKKYVYLTRGSNKLSFRIPNNKDLIKLLKRVGPLVAPSANLQGMPPSSTIKEAEEYFGADVDIYVGKGKMKTVPSTIVEMLPCGCFEMIREGAVKASSKKLRGLLE